MPSLWIVHRDPQRRAAMARLAAAPEDALLGAPGDPIFDSAPPADAVVLGLGGDWEGELEFVHRVRARLEDADWILLAERADLERARRLFDSLGAAILAYPPEAQELRRRLRAPAPRRPWPAPLSRRPLRSRLSERFARWFGDLELPELLRALDPRLGDVSLLIRGEPGTGRGLLARYVHAFGRRGGELAAVSCGERSAPAAIAEAIAATARGQRSPVSVLLEDVDRLSRAAQRELCGWIEFGPPPALASLRIARWMASAGAGERDLEPGLRRALSGLAIELPPLRERPSAVAQVASDTARTWCAARGERPRRFEETALLALEEYPWPGNLRELEAVVVQTLAATGADPISAADLRVDGDAFAPVNAADVESLAAEPEGGGRERLAELLPEEEPLEAEAIFAGDEEPLEAELAEGDDGDEFELPEFEAPELPDFAEPVPASESALRRLAGAVAHEVRNPLTAIRTFAELLPEHHGDDEFRTRFAELVSRDVLRIEDVVDRLSRLAALGPPDPGDIDVSALLEELLEARRDAIRERRLLVLKELDSDEPLARADALQLRLAFEALLDGCFELVPERGDVYLASRHHPAGLRGRPSVRVLVRFHGPARREATAPVPGTSPAENALEFAIAEWLVRAQGGTLALDTSEADETIVVLDLPAPDS